MATRIRQTLDYTDTVAATAKSLTDLGYTATNVKNARSLTVTSDVAVRYLTAGTPTASYGHIVPADETVTFSGGGTFFDSVQFVSTTGTATLTLTLGTFGEA